MCTHNDGSGEKIPLPTPRLVTDFDPPNNPPPSREKRLYTLTVGSGTNCVVLLYHEDKHGLSSLQRTHTVNSTQYRIAATASSGLGVFLTTNVERGELILSERPLVVYPHFLPFYRELPPERAYPELEDAISRLSPDRHEAFVQLANSHPQEPSQVKGIVDTNALHIGSLPGSKQQYAAVCNDISRINHSCSPNAAYRFDLATFTIEVRALFPIPAGSQVFISYIDPALPRAARQKALLEYGFACGCDYCSLTGSALEQSETRRSLIARADTGHAARDATLERWARDPNMPDDHVNRIDKMYMDLFEAEHLYYEPVWEGFATRLCKACCAVEDFEGARKWAGLARALNCAYAGEDRGWAAVEGAPEQTEWWGRRRKAHVPVPPR